MARMSQIANIVDWYAMPSISVQIVAERFFSMRFWNRPTDETIIAKAVPEARTCIRALESLKGDGAYMVGDDVTIADLMLAPHLAYFAMTAGRRNAEGEFAFGVARSHGIASKHAGDRAGAAAGKGGVGRMADAAAAIAALADPTRRQVFERLRHGPQPVGVIARGLPVSRPAVSQHLAVLKSAGLVTDRAEGTRRVYQIDPHGLGAIRAWLDQFWDEALLAFKQEAEARNNETEEDE